MSEAELGKADSPSLTSRTRVLAALRRQAVDSPPIVNPTSIATVELMHLAEAGFPAAHRTPGPMAELAAAGHTELGFDTVMPVFSIVQESSALGCHIEWGRSDEWPTVTEPIWRTPDDIAIRDGFLEHPDIRCVLDAIQSLRRRFGDEVAIFGKVMGPWTLCYSTFGLEPFLIMTIDDPAGTARCLARLKEVTVAFGLAQIEAGADAVTVADHATGDLVSAECYRRYLKDIHAELVERLPVPLILHICGRTLDRMADIAETGVAAFHFDSKNSPEEAVTTAGGRMALIGNVNNPVTLLRGGPKGVRAEVERVLEASVDMIAPECAVPLNAPIGNLREISRSVPSYQTRRVGPSHFPPTSRSLRE
jgi:[methyl-Co(III) methanol-specific corrinoid protein]:coenzyme M methyltransferase